MSPPKTAKPIEIPFGLRTWVGPGNHVLDAGPDPPWEGAILRGNGRPIVVICAKTAEPIDWPFGFWTWVGRRKHKFNCIRQVAPVCTISIVFATWRQFTRQHSALSCAKTDQFAVCHMGAHIGKGKGKPYSLAS